MHKMGQVCVPHPCHSSSHNPHVHCQKTPFAQPNSRAATKKKHDTGGKRVVGDITKERKVGQQVHKMGQGLCTTPMPQPLTQPSHALPKNAICTTKLTGCDEGRMTQEGNTPRGNITQERKEGQQVHKMGRVCAPHPCHNPSHNRCMHCRKTPFAQPNSRAATKEP